MTTTAIGKPPRPPTDRQLEIYTFVFERTMRDGFQPSFQEVIDVFGFTGKTGLVGHLRALARKGWIEISPFQARRIRFLRRPDGSPFLGFTPVEERWTS